MNTNDISAVAGSRLNRVQKVSRSVRLVLQYGIPIWVLLCLLLGVLQDPGWHARLRDSYGIRIPPVKFLATHSSPGELRVHLSASVLTTWGVLQLAIFLPWYRTLLKLFRLFERGILFTAETARCIQFLGGIYAVKWLLEWTFQFLFPDGVFWGFFSGVNNLFACVFLVTIGWLMEEAHKMREEQELTV